jgi:hypothetical protein
MCRLARALYITYKEQTWTGRLEKAVIHNFFINSPALLGVEAR